MAVELCPAALARGDAGLQGLFSSLSREVCRPLISIRAGLDLLLAGCEGAVSVAQRRQLLGLKRHCDSLIGLTRSFLDDAAAERGCRPLDMASFRIAALLHEVDRQFSCITRMRGIEWSCGLVGPGARVTTDLACLQQVLGRLVENALACVGPGGTIGVSGMADGDGWGVAVSYDGPAAQSHADAGGEPSSLVAPCAPAMPEERLEPYGLAVCRQLAGRLGGEISTRPAGLRGRTVVVRFPRCSPQDDAPG